MITIYADRRKSSRCHYIEDLYASAEIVGMEKEAFAVMIKNFEAMSHRHIHTCYPTFVNHIGRFIRENGPDWMGEEIVVATYNDRTGELREPHV